MIEFKSKNVDWKTREWKFNSAKELEEEWCSERCAVPSNDDPIWDVKINGKEDLREATYDKIKDEDAVCFSDLLIHLRIKYNMNSDSIKEMFPDWKYIRPGNWSAHGRKLDYGLGHFIEIGLYREPLDSGEYAGRYTLHIFDGDEVIFCADVDDER